MRAPLAARTRSTPARSAETYSLLPHAGRSPQPSPDRLSFPNSKEYPEPRDASLQIRMDTGTKTSRALWPLRWRTNHSSSYRLGHCHRFPSDGAGLADSRKPACAPVTPWRRNGCLLSLAPSTLIRPLVIRKARRSNIVLFNYLLTWLSKMSYYCAW